MKKITLTLLILIFSVSFSLSQVSPDTTQQSTQQVKTEKPPKQKQPIGQKIYFGGGVGLTFGSYFRIALYPMIGYKFTPKLSGGVEIGYEYISDNRFASNYKTSNYGASNLIEQMDYFDDKTADYHKISN